jgi:hypothetical protein
VEERRVSLNVPFEGRLGACASKFNLHRHNITPTKKVLFIQHSLSLENGIV